MVAGRVKSSDRCGEGGAGSKLSPPPFCEWRSVRSTELGGQEVRIGVIGENCQRRVSTMPGSIECMDRPSGDRKMRRNRRRAPSGEVGSCLSLAVFGQSLAHSVSFDIWGLISASAHTCQGDLLSEIRCSADVAPSISERVS